jgi:uncharacterized protein (DUF1697 family)
VRILYLADIRFPLERANGIQSVETCHALASRGHDVTLIVRPDTHTPARDPYAFYGLAPLPMLHVETAPLTGPPAARRAGYLTYAIGRALGRARQDVIFTRDLALASLLLHVPGAMRAPLVYEAHTIAADAAAARPELLTGAAAASPAKLESQLEAEIEKRFGLDVEVHVRSAAELAAVIKANPFAAEATRDPSHLLVTFYKTPLDKAKVKAAQAAIDGPERLRADGRHLYMVFPEGIGRSKAAVVVGKKLGPGGTARNWNTVQKLAALAPVRGAASL